MNNQEQTAQERRLEREKARFAKQITKDLERSQGKRLSQNVVRKLINNDTAQWAREIANQKAAQLYSSNNANQPNTSTPNISSSVGQEVNGSTSVLPAQPSPPNTSSTQKIRFGGNKGDILYWDPSEDEGNGDWVVLSAPSGDTLRVLTIQNNNLAWTATEDCA